jgi:hypothetical protein
MTIDLKGKIAGVGAGHGLGKTMLFLASGVVANALLQVGIQLRGPQSRRIHRANSGKQWPTSTALQDGIVRIVDAAQALWDVGYPYQ